MGRLDPLTAYLLDSGEARVVLSFTRIERIIDGKLPASARNHPAFWSNSTQNHYSAAWRNAGYRTTTRDVPAGQIGFDRVRRIEAPTRPDAEDAPASTAREPIDPLEAQFHAAMIRVYEQASSEVGYRATRFLQMVRNRGGLEAARRLLASGTVSRGFEVLAAAKRLDITVEALVLDPVYRELFSAHELATAQGRLDAFG